MSATVSAILTADLAAADLERFSRLRRIRAIPRRIPPQVKREVRPG
jgi:hypothetical protein